jgi:hypothetical protein
MARPGPVPASLFALLAAATAAHSQGLSTHRAQRWDQVTLALPDAAEIADQLGTASTTGDFDGDGFSDLAIGVPNEALPGVAGEAADAGAVLVVHGGGTGLAGSGAQSWHQDSPGIADEVEEGDWFGAALAAGDFDGDGFDDLAIGAYSEDLTDADGAGVVHVLYGAAGGLGSVASQLWSQADPLVEGEAESSDGFGWALAAGDFDGDGYDDLAVGVPNDPGGPGARTGGFHVLFGSAGGLTPDGDQYWRGIEIGAAYEDDCRFGKALAAGDFDADGFADLAVGAPWDDFVDQLNVGSTRVFFGSDQGLTTDRDVYLLGPEALGWQGWALAAGDLDGDGDDDLAIGIPRRTVGGDAVAGAVTLRYGDGGAMLDGGEWSQDTAGVQGGAEPGDQFGAALASGDFDRDGREDLAVGVPREGLAEPSEGVVHVLFGSATGLTAVNDQLWTRDQIPVPDPSVGNSQDRFGWALAVGDFDGTGHADLAMGSPGERLDVGGLPGPGAVFVLHGALFADGFESEDTSAWSSVQP